MIGSCSALSGPAKLLGTRQLAGAQAYLNSVNDQGGVFGRKIKLLTYDDCYDPDKAEDCFAKLLAKRLLTLFYPTIIRGG